MEANEQQAHGGLVFRPVGRPRKIPSNETPEEAEARRAYSRQYNAANRERLREYYKQWQQQNKGRVNEYSKAYQARLRARREGLPPQLEPQPEEPPQPEAAAEP